METLSHRRRSSSAPPASEAMEATRGSGEGAALDVADEFSDSEMDPPYDFPGIRPEGGGLVGPALLEADRGHLQTMAGGSSHPAAVGDSNLQGSQRPKEDLERQSCGGSAKAVSTAKALPNPFWSDRAMAEFELQRKRPATLPKEADDMELHPPYQDLSQLERGDTREHVEVRSYALQVTATPSPKAKEPSGGAVTAQQYVIHSDEERLDAMGGPGFGAAAGLTRPASAASRDSVTHEVLAHMLEKMERLEAALAEQKSGSGSMKSLEDGRRLEGFQAPAVQERAPFPVPLVQDIVSAPSQTVREVMVRVGGIPQRMIIDPEGNLSWPFDPPGLPSGFQAQPALPPPVLPGVSSFPSQVRPALPYQEQSSALDLHSQAQPVMPSAAQQAVSSKAQPGALDLRSQAQPVTPSVDQQALSSKVQSGVVELRSQAQPILSSHVHPRPPQGPVVVAEDYAFTGGLPQTSWASSQGSVPAVGQAANLISAFQTPCSSAPPVGVIQDSDRLAFGSELPQPPSFPAGGFCWISGPNCGRGLALQHG